MELENTQPEEVESPEHFEPAPPVTNRFLFVDIAALRAKQLRRGARPRIEALSDNHPLPLKAERVAMEEVRRQKVQFDLPAPKAPIHNLETGI
jgi:DNA-directed RNA polymerase subunit K/omega